MKVLQKKLIHRPGLMVSSKGSDVCLLQSTLVSCGCCCWWHTARGTPMLISYRSTSERASARTSQTAWASETYSPGPARLCWRTFLESTQVKGALCAGCSHSIILLYMGTLKVAVKFCSGCFLIYLDTAKIVSVPKIVLFFIFRWVIFLKSLFLSAKV